MAIAGPDNLTEKRRLIVETALAIAREEGLDAVSMRRVAERLEVGTMTLYTYVSDKDELVDLMRDQVAREMLVPEPLPGDWREALREIAVRTRDAFEANPWLASAWPRRPRFRLATARHIEQSMAVVAMLGIGREDGRTLLMAVDDYVIGHCYRSQAFARMREEAEGKPNDLDPEIAAAIEAGDLPNFARVVEALGGAPVAPPPSDFEQGLEWMLDGIEADVAAGGDRG